MMSELEATVLVDLLEESSLMILSSSCSSRPAFLIFFDFVGFFGSAVRLTAGFLLLEGFLQKSHYL